MAILTTVIRHFLQSIIKIVRENEIELPKFLYKLILILFFLQNLNYLAKNQIKIIYERSYDVLAWIIFYSNFSNFFFSSERSILFDVSYILANLLIYLPLLFICFAFFFYQQKRKINFGSLILGIIAKMFTLWFVLHPWVFFIPINDILLGVFEQQDSTFALSIVSLVGVVFNVFLGVFSVWINRNIDFIDHQNIQFSFGQNGFVFFYSKLLLSFLSHFMTGNLIFFLILQAIFWFEIFYLWLNFPLRNKDYCSFFFGSLIFSEILSFSLYLWQVSSLFDQNSSFYIAFTLIPISFKLGRTFFNFKINNSTFNDLNTSRDPIFCLEELNCLLNDQLKKNEFFLQGIVSHHFRKCTEGPCVLLGNHYQRKRGDHEHYVHKLILFKFKKKLKSERKNFQNFGLVLLKLMDFLVNTHLNPIKSFLEIQKSMKFYHGNDISVFVSVYVEFFRKKIQEKLKESTKLDSHSKTMLVSEMKTEKYYKIAKLQNVYEKNLRALINEKRDFWQKYQLGIGKTKDLIDISSSLLRKISLFKDQISLVESSKTPFEKSQNLVKTKFLSIYHCTLVNSMNMAFKYEEAYRNQIRSEPQNDDKILQTLSFLDSDIAICLVSFLKQEGRILDESKNKNLASFFGYSFQEFRMIRGVENLMPGVIGAHHSCFVSRFFKKTAHEIEISKRYIESFAVKKNECIFPLRVFRGYNFDYHDDFVMIGALIKGDSENGKDYDWLCNEFGETIGISEGILKMFKEKYDFFDVSCANQIIIPCLVPELKFFLEKANKSKEKTCHFSNQNGTLYFPGNLKHILECLNLLKNELTTSKKFDSSIYSRTINTIKSNRSHKSDKSHRSALAKSYSKVNKFVNYGRNTMKAPLEEEENSNALRQTIFEQEMGNQANVDKFHITFDFNSQVHRFGPEEENVLIVNHFKIKSLRTFDETRFKSSSSLGVNQGEYEIVDINSDQKIPLENSPNYNSSNFENQILITEKDEIKNTIQQDAVKYFDRTNPTQNVVVLNKIQKKQSLTIEKISTSSYNEGFKKKLNTKSHFSSISDRKTSYLIFHTIEDIQNSTPVFITRIYRSLILELLLIIIYFSVLYSLYQQYVSANYEPIQKSMISYCSIATTLSYSTAIFTEAEYEKFNLTNRTHSPFKKMLWTKILTENYLMMRELNFQERNMAGNLNYQQVFKNVENKFVDFADEKLKIKKYSDVLDSFSDLLFLSMNDFDKNLDSDQIISMQRNYPYMLPSTSTIYLAAKGDFQNSNNGTTQNFMIILIVFILINVCLKVFQLRNFLSFHRNIVRIINVFQRCDNRDCNQELQLLQIISNSFIGNFMQMNFPEKAIEDRKIKLSNRLENSMVQKPQKSSILNARPLPKTIIYVLIICLLIVSVFYYFFNYYFWINNNVTIGSLININTSFIDVYIYATSIMGFNTLALREKITSNPKYEAINDPYQNSRNRSLYFYNNLIKRLYIIGNSSAFSLPQYTIEAKNAMQSQDFDNLVMDDICKLLLKKGLLNNSAEELDFCQNSFHGSFQQGILPLLNEYIQEIKDFLPYIQVFSESETVKIAQQKQEVINLINSQAYEDYMFAYYYFHNTLLIYYNTINDFYKGVMDGQMSKLYLFLIFSSIFCSLGYFCFANYLNRKLAIYYKFVSLSLSLIPYNKIVNDEQIKFLIINLFKKTQEN